MVLFGQMGRAIVILSSHYNSHAHLTKKYQKELKVTMVVCDDTKKNLKSVRFTKILG